MMNSRMIVALAIAGLASGCQTDESVVSGLEGKGITVSRGLDGSPKTVRFNSGPATVDDLMKVAEISTIQEVYGSSPEATDDVLSKLAERTTLAVIEIRDSKATGKAIDAFAKANHLQKLSLENATGIDDAAIAGLADNSSIQSLNLSGTKVTDASTSTLTSMTGLVNLTLAGTAFTDAGVQGLAEGLPQLTSIELQGDQITDASVTALGTLKQLEKVDLSKCSVAGSTLEALTNLEKLQFISLRDCSEVDDDAVAKLSGCDLLANLDVSGTKFTGSRIGEGGFAELAAILANNTAVTAAAIPNFKAFKSLYSVSLKGTPVTMEQVREHFASNHQTAFTVDAGQ